MSNAPFARLPVAVLKNRQLSSWARLLYALLVDYHSEEAGCFPGQTRLADDLGVSVDTVGRSLRELEGVGLVRHQRRGRGHTNAYELALDSAVMRNQAEDESASVRHQEGDDSADTRNQKDDSAPVRIPETASVRNQTPHDSAPVRNNPDPVNYPDLDQPEQQQAPAQERQRWTYAAMLNGTYLGILNKFKRMSGNELTEPWFRRALIAAEQEAGPVVPSVLDEGLKAASHAVERRLKAEREGGKPVGDLDSYARAIVVAKIKDFANATTNGATDEAHAAPQRPDATQTQPDRTGIRRYLRGP